MNELGTIITISGPSSVGKSKTIRELCKKGGQYKKIISYTTRSKRKEEIDGVDYNFISREKFINMIKRNAFLYWKKSREGLYGLDILDLSRGLKSTQIVLVDVDVEAVIELKRYGYKVISFFLAPKTMKVIYKRLLDRGKERGISSCNDVKVRFYEAIRMIDFMGLFDYVLINENIKKTVELIERIIEVEQIKKNKDTLIAKMQKDACRYKLFT